MSTGREVKAILRKKGIKNYELAESLKIAESTMCRRLRDKNKITGQEEQDIFNAIRRIEEKKTARA